MKILEGICMLCGIEGLEFIENTRDYEEFKVAQCNSCGHVQVTPLPDMKADEIFYQKDEMVRKLRPKEEKTDLELMYYFESWADYQCNTMKNIVTKKQTILELGSGYGWFVKKMNEKGYKVKGLELSNTKCKMAKKELGVDLYNYNILSEELFDDIVIKFDVIVAFHVLEHIYNPILFLEKAKKFLKKGGKIVCEVPNYNDWNKSINEGYRKFTYMRTHLSYFKPETLKMVFIKAGYFNIKIHGIQEYSFENSLNWIKTSKPYKECHQLNVPKELDWLDKYYKKKLEKKLESYAILAIANLEEVKTNENSSNDSYKIK